MPRSSFQGESRQVTKPARYCHPTRAYNPTRYKSLSLPPCESRLRAHRISAGLEIMAVVTGNLVEHLHYKLYGVHYHHGESAGSGHYG